MENINNFVRLVRSAELHQHFPSLLIFQHKSILKTHIAARHLSGSIFKIRKCLVHVILGTVLSSGHISLAFQWILLHLPHNFFLLFLKVSSSVLPLAICMSPPGLIIHRHNKSLNTCVLNTAIWSHTSLKSLSLCYWHSGVIIWPLILMYASVSYRTISLLLKMWEFIWITVLIIKWRVEELNRTIFSNKKKCVNLVVLASFHYDCGGYLAMVSWLADGWIAV